jgi:hypothetical protein
MARLDHIRDYVRDAARVLKCLKAGGIAIVDMHSLYAVMTGAEEALRKVYTATNRSMNRGSRGIVANQRTHDEIRLLPDDTKKNIRAITHEHDLPLSVIAPFQTNHPLFNGINAIFA